MREKRPPLRQDYLLEIFHYSELDGRLRWKKLPRGGDKLGRAEVGKVAGNYANGYGDVSIMGKVYQVHRIIFTIVYGYYPENFIDHIDGNISNNHHTNLREVSQSCNMRNACLRVVNKVGVTGVGFHKKSGMFRARITVNREEMYLGVFPTVEEAVLARYNKEIEVNWSHCKRESSAYRFLKMRSLI